MYWENADWCCIVSTEKKRGTERYYLTFNRVKIRYRPENDTNYFNHPFQIDNRIQLIDDVFLETSLSEQSLGTDFDGVEDITSLKGKRNAVDREVIDDETDNIFDFNASINGKRKAS